MLKVKSLLRLITIIITFLILALLIDRALPLSDNLKNSSDRLFNQSIKLARLNSKPDILSFIALQLSKSGQKELSSQLFNESIKALEKESKERREIYTTSIAINMAKDNRFEQALQLIEKSKPSRDRVEVYTEAAIATIRQGKIDKANKLLDLSWEIAKSLNYVYESNSDCYKERGDALQIVAKGLAAADRLKEAMDISNLAGNCYFHFDDYELQGFQNIISQVSQLDKLNSILARAKLLKNKNHRTRDLAMSAIAVRYAELGDIKVAMQIGEQIILLAVEEQKEEDNFVGLDAEIELVKATKTNDLAIAAESAKQAKDKSLVEISLILIQKQKFKEANQLAILIPKGSPYQNLASVIKAKYFLESGQLKLANQLFEEVVKAQDQEIVIALIKIGKLDSVLKTLKYYVVTTDLDLYVVEELIECKAFKTALDVSDLIYKNNSDGKAKAIARIAASIHK